MMNARARFLAGVVVLLCLVTMAPASDLVNAVSDHGVYGKMDEDLVSAEFPAGSQKYYLWEGRLWIGAKVNNQIRVTAAGPGEYEWTPAGGGQPELIEIGGDLLETTAGFNDLVAVPGHTPIGLEVTQTVTAWSWVDQPQSAHQIAITVENASGVAIDSVYVGWVWDFDVAYGPEGDDEAASQDDRAGWDADRLLGYMYDGDNPDEPGDDTGDGGISPGYIGAAWLESGADPASFQVWTSGNDPDTDALKFQYLAGMPPGGGDPFEDPPTDPADYRVMLSVGPFSMAAGQTEDVVICLAAGEGLAGLEDATDEMIAYYNRPVQFEMVPQQTVIPPDGGDLIYGVNLTSELPNTVPGVAYWTDIEFPNGQTFNAVRLIPFTLTPFMDVSIVNILQPVPYLAPPGDYIYYGHVGFFPNALLNDFITFEKTGDGPASVTWQPEQWESNAAAQFAAAFEENDGVTTVLPDGFELSAAHPNPFNAATSVTVMLPQRAEMTVQLINVTGQTVATVADGSYESGQHRFSVDAAGLASGIYFLQATAGDLGTRTQKVVLVR